MLVNVDNISLAVPVCHTLPENGVSNFLTSIKLVQNRKANTVLPGYCSNNHNHFCENSSFVVFKQKLDSDYFGNT